MSELLLNEDLERVTFENWYSEGNQNCRSVERNGSGGYKLINTQASWNVWKARAAIQPLGGEYICPKCGIRQSQENNDQPEF